jgi:uncharacterized protein (DUF1778 family)
MNGATLSAVIRAARELRNEARNVVLKDVAAKKAWDALDRALNGRDDFLAEEIDRG